MNKILLLFLIFSSAPVLSQNSNWQNLEMNGSSQARHENGLVAVGDQLILIGGRGDKLLDIYDTTKKEWKTGAQPPFEIHHMQAVQLDGLIYIVGAFTGSYPYEIPLTHILIYDPTEDKWATGPEIPSHRRRGAAGAVVHNNKIYLINGIINGHSSGWVNWMDEFDPGTGKWRELPDSPRARDHFQAQVINNKIYVAGGRRSGSGQNPFQGTVSETDVFDFTTNLWSSLNDIPTPRAGTAAAVYNNNYVVLGGESDAQKASHMEVEMLDIKTNTWKKLSPLNSGRHGTQAVALDNKIIIGSGSGNRGGGPELNSFEILSAEENTEISSEAYISGKLVPSETTVKLGNENSKTISISNSEGNKAIFIAYLLLNNSKNFELQLKRSAPLVLAPGEKLDIEINRKKSSGGESSAKLFVKSLGSSEPLIIEISD